jgi:Ca-activated chloride channel homolog
LRRLTGKISEPASGSERATLPNAARLAVNSLTWLAATALFICLPGMAGSAQNLSGNAKAANAAGNVQSQGAKPANGNPSIKVRVNVVNVPVSVLDKAGIPVVDLSKNDFKLYEDGTRQTIRYFSSAVVPPLRIGLILDTSNSARFELKFEQSAASDFAYSMLRGLHSGNEIFLETFDANSSLVQGFTDDPDVLNDKIQKLKAGGGKSVYDAIYDACEEEMKAGPREGVRRVLLLISDGIDVESKHTLDDAISMAHRAETSIYTIGNTAYGYSNPGDKYLARIAGETGGAVFFPRRDTPGANLMTGYTAHGTFDNMDQNKGLDVETGVYTAERMIALADSLDAIRRELANQYLIGYTPTDSTLDGTYRAIRVVTDRKGVVVRNKPGYFATAGE